MLLIQCLKQFERRRWRYGWLRSSLGVHCLQRFGLRRLPGRRTLTEACLSASLECCMLRELKQKLRCWLSSWLRSWLCSWL